MTVSNKAQLKKTVKNLISLFDETITITRRQNKAVMNHNLEKINKLAEDQIELNSKMRETEEEFHSELKKAFKETGILSDNNISLTVLITQAGDEEGSDFFQLRDELVSKVHTAKEEQKRVNELLLFAQENVNDTLRAVYAMGKQQSLHYNKSGEKSQSQTSIINRTA